MIITRHDELTLRLQSGDLVLLADPVGARQKGDIVLRTSSIIDASALPADEIIMPGEYELKGVEIEGFPAGVQGKTLHTIYQVTWEDMRLVFLGNISKLPEGGFMKEITEPDVLFIPAGGDGLTPADAAKLTKQLEPSVVIPIAYKNAQDFPKAMGEKVDPQEKFVFKKKELVEKQCRVVILQQ